jgi:hypothetical protein
LVFNCHLENTAMPPPKFFHRAAIAVLVAVAAFAPWPHLIRFRTRHKASIENPAGAKAPSYDTPPEIMHDSKQPDRYEAPLFEFGDGVIRNNYRVELHLGATLAEHETASNEIFPLL